MAVGTCNQKINLIIHHVRGYRLIGVMALFARRPLPEMTTRAMGAVASAIALGIDRKIYEGELLLARTEAMVNHLDAAFAEAAGCHEGLPAARIRDDSATGDSLI